MATTINEALAKATSQLGGYFPGNSPYGTWYAGRHGAVYNNAQFCAMGLSWVFAQVGGLDIFPEHAYTPSGVNWFKSKGRWHTGSINNIKRGDIVYFNFGAPLNRVSHVGIAEKDGSGGKVQTIEFNTSSVAGGSQRNGRTVARKVRSSWIVGWGRPAYKAAPATSNKSASKLADEVMAGLHGTGDARKKSLGSQYNAVQAEVNRRVSSGAKPASKPASKSVSQLADEVLAGKHGTGDARKKSLGSQYSAVQAEVNKRASAKPKKSISQLADEVLEGKHGNGAARQRSLGSQYAAVRKEVNKRLAAKPKKTVSQLAQEVIDGKYGSGAARKKSLGSQYNAVQAEVNRRLR